MEDFSQPTLDSQRWTVYDAPTKTPNGTLAANTSVSGGELLLSGAVDGPIGGDGKPTDVGSGIGSNIDMTYGRWEFRMRAEPGAGYRATSTLWPQSDLWPADGEIDIIEITQGDRLSANYFSHKPPGSTATSHPIRGCDFTLWHVFGIDWEPTGLSYYLDNQLMWTVTDKTYVPNKPMHLTLQLDTTCGDSGLCRTSATPARVTMHVDWVKTYKP